MHLFYSTDIINNHATLSAEESAHCIRVLRMNRGDKLNIIDGMGHLFEAYIDTPDASKCGVIITRTEFIPHPRKSKIHIAIAPTKSIDRFEWFVEKAVEIGIDLITPMICHYSERKAVNIGRLEKIIISSMKQARIFYRPEIKEITSFNSVIKHYSGQPNCFIAYCGNNFSPRFNEVLQLHGDVTILIGPEGDFSKMEISQSIESGFISVSLGPSRLRTETAGIVACHTINILDP